MIYTHMLIQGLFGFCGFTTDLTIIDESIWEVYAFHMIQHIGFQGINMATNGALPFPIRFFLCDVVRQNSSIILPCKKTISF